jgi:hypothetical protein
MRQRPALQPGKPAIDMAAIDIGVLADRIARTQLAGGAIPWSKGAKTDPWDHVESAMGLAVVGRVQAARRAFDWLRKMQLPDGSWYAGYLDGAVSDRTRETNMAAYVAVGLWHHYLITGDLELLTRMWPSLRRAIDFALSLQTAEGEIYWAISPEGLVDPMALLTGCSSIYMSVKCALAIARLLDREPVSWTIALAHLGTALKHKPHRFNMTKARFSMDWFYPVLSGAVTGAAAHRRIDRGWKKFVVEGLGVRCVSDQPWVTVAESSELVLALAAMGNTDLARIVFDWICDHTFDDGSFWCGFTFPDMTVWPEEKIAWTNAAVLLAADALYGLTPAADIFSHRFWQEMGLDAP